MKIILSKLFSSIITSDEFRYACNRLEIKGQRGAAGASFLFMISHPPVEITYGISRKCRRSRWFPVSIGLTYRAECAFESSNICACHIHRVQLVPREERRVMRCGMHTCVTYTYMYALRIQAVTREGVTSRARESTLRGRLVSHLNAFDIRFLEVGQGSSRRCISTREFPRSRAKRRPPHVRIANVCPSVKPRVDARRGPEKETKEDEEDGEEEEWFISLERAKILPRVLVPPVEHPDGKRVGTWGGARKGCPAKFLSVCI